MAAELLTSGGTLVTASELFQAGLLVRDGQIKCIGRKIETAGDPRRL